MAGAVRTITTRFVADISQWSRQMNQAQSTMSRVGKSMTAIGSKLTMAVTLPILAVGTAATKMAMEAVESENLFNESMGSMANKTRLWSEELSKALGLNSYNVRKTVGTYNVMLTSMGLSTDAAYRMSTGLTKLSYDMASFYNLSNEDAMQKLQSGISGEVEPLKRLGIVVNETMVKTYALKNGLVKQGQEMSEGQKVVARYLTIMDATKKAQGDLARTMNSPSNQLRMLKEKMSLLGIEIGQKLIPVMQKLISFANVMLNVWNNLNPATQNTILAVTGLAAAIGPLVLAIGAATTALNFMMANPVVAAIAGIGALVEVLAVATNGFGFFEKAQRSAQDEIIETTAKMISQKKAANDLGNAIIGVSSIEAKQAKDRYYNDLMKESQAYELLLSQRRELEKRQESKLYPVGFDMTTQIDVKQKQIVESMNKMKESRKKMDEAQTIIDGWKKIETPKWEPPSGSDDWFDDWKDEFEKLGGSGSETYDKMTDKVKEFVDAIKSQTKEFNNFVGVFEKASSDSPIGMNRWINRLKGQLNAIKTYQQSINILQDKAAKGVISQGLFSELQGLGPTAAKQLQVLSKATNAQLKQANSLYGQKYGIAQSLAYQKVNSDMAAEAKVVQIINNFNGGAKDEEITKISKKISDQIIQQLKQKGIL